jgi:hypothetical protein
MTFDSEDLYQLLSRVARNILVFHGLTEVHAPGWSWVSSDMSPEFQGLCDEALREHLIELGRHHYDGFPASLSPEGSLRLAELRQWHLQHAGGVA